MENFGISIRMMGKNFIYESLDGGAVDLHKKKNLS